MLKVKFKYKQGGFESNETVDFSQYFKGYIVSDYHDFLIESGLDEDSSAEEFAKSVLDYFNLTLRPGEKRREYISCEEVE